MKNKIYSAPLWFVIFLFLPFISDCQELKNRKSPEYYSQAIRNSATILSRAKDELKAPAISIAVGIKNQIVWSQALYKNIESQEAADINTKFRIGSTSKAVTSVALGKLMQNKLIDLDGAIQSYVPFFDASKPPVTIRQLASHTSGIRNYKNAEFESNIEYASIKESMTIFMYDSLLFDPGSKFSYATYNYTVLSAAIEQVAGTSYLEYIQKEVFTPLGMINTSGDYKARDIENRAQFYDYIAAENKIVKAQEVNNSNKWAGGGLISTPSDLVKLGNALLNNTILKPTTKAILFEPQRLSDGVINGTRYALGWRNDSATLFNHTKRVQQIHHGGSSSGSTSLLVLFPAYNLCISILVNRGGFASADIFKYVHKIAEEFVSAKQ